MAKQRIHITQEGETFASIAERYYDNRAYGPALEDWNNGGLLHPGRELVIPTYLLIKSEGSGKENHIYLNRKKSKKTGEGRFAYEKGIFTVRLYNFDVDSAQLKPEHKKFLDEEIAPKLANGNSISLIGLASRSGPGMHNERISESRADRVHEYLTDTTHISFECRIKEWNGERSAKEKGEPDDSEDDWYRAVIVMTSPAYEPPDPGDAAINKIANRQPQDHFKHEASGETLSQILDIAPNVSDVLELLPWATAAKAAEVLGPVGIAIQIFQTLAQPVILHMQVEEQNKFLGTIQGLAEAIQDMADQYDDTVALSPSYSWPKIKEPAVRSIGHEFGSEPWMQGKKQGVKMAFECFKEIDNKKVTINGHAYTGKELLRVFKKKFGSNTRKMMLEAFIRIVNQKGGFEGIDLHKL